MNPPSPHRPSSLYLCTLLRTHCAQVARTTTTTTTTAYISIQTPNVYTHPAPASLAYTHTQSPHLITALACTRGSRRRTHTHTYPPTHVYTGARAFQVGEPMLRHLSLSLSCSLPRRLHAFYTEAPSPRRGCAPLRFSGEQEGERASKLGVLRTGRFGTVYI